ncbi:MAG: bifunctional diaminohydroxyphosphoribosylaminopyrimidine deaminase/5-amino-6-(5-phosphoribosylamino)uracil reductase RibD [Armatimonadetes bacterium]|nr:bifunctional diaminohydroxyphosphoribosylaminopyrimidine deaminase/5-amino-6-(5-phosphoribosylamino)uracil reductase RibD [Armatimonadota bacterium]
MSGDPAAFMGRAVELARGGYPAPNPHVGCVLVKDGRIVGEGFHRFAGGPHAEIVALNEAGPAARGSTVYVTQEPCSGHGRTPPCTEALLAAGVKRVVAATLDPNPAMSGGLEVLRSKGVQTESGLLADDARAANVVWLTAMERRRPYVTVKAAVTLDGFMARSDGTSRWITCEASRRAGRLLRAEMGAVLVGRGTVQADDPLLTVREPEAVNEPVRVIIDPRAVLTGKERAFQQPGQTVWCVAGQRQADPRQLPMDFGDGFEVRLLESLFTIGVRGVLIEGGPETIGRFARAGAVDRLITFVAPTVFGTGAAFPYAAFGTCDLVLLRAFQSETDAALEFACVCT